MLNGEGPHTDATSIYNCFPKVGLMTHEHILTKVSSL